MLLFAADAVPKEFFTPQSLLTFTGATAATLVVTNAARTLASISPFVLRWIGFVVAEVVCTLGAAFTTEPTGVTYAIAALNGCAVFLAAAGGMQGISQAAGAKATGDAGGGGAGGEAGGAAGAPAAPREPLPELAPPSKSTKRQGRPTPVSVKEAFSRSWF